MTNPSQVTSDQIQSTNQTHFHNFNHRETDDQDSRTRYHQAHQKPTTSSNRTRPSLKLLSLHPQSQSHRSNHHHQQHRHHSFHQSHRHRFPNHSDHHLLSPLHHNREDPIQSYIPHHHHHDDEDERDEGHHSNSSFTDHSLSHDSDYEQQSPSIAACSSDSEDGLLRLRIDESRQQHLLRHGFNEVYNSESYLGGLAKRYFMYWDDTPYKTTKPSDLIQVLVISSSTPFSQPWLILFDDFGRYRTGDRLSSIALSARPSFSAFDLVLIRLTWSRPSQPPNSKPGSTPSSFPKNLSSRRSPSDSRTNLSHSRPRMLG